MLPIDFDLGNIGDLGHTQLFSDLGTDLSGITVDCLTTAEDDVSFLYADLLDRGVLEGQGSLDGIKVIGVGDGIHGGTVHGTVFFNSNLTGGIRYLLYTYDAFHNGLLLLSVDL